MVPTKQLKYFQTFAVLRGEESVIGRSEYSSIVIAHPSVSRVHASITLREGKTFIQDLGSRNGTFVNGAPIAQTPVRVYVGDPIRIGNVECVIELNKESALTTTDSSSELPLPADTTPIPETGR